MQVVIARKIIKSSSVDAKLHFGCEQLILRLQCWFMLFHSKERDQRRSKGYIQMVCVVQPDKQKASHSNGFRINIDRRAGSHSKKSYARSLERSICLAFIVVKAIGCFMDQKRIDQIHRYEKHRNSPTIDEWESR